MVMNIENYYETLLHTIRCCKTDKENVIVKKFIDNHRMLFTNRQKSRITNLDRLLYELDKRSLISLSNIQYLGHIVDELQNQVVSSDYRRLCNFLQDSYDLQSCQRHNLPQPRPGDQRPGLSQEVKRLVAEKIGRKWNCLGRQLCVPEAKLDNIDDNYKDHDIKMCKIFEYFEGTTPPSEQNFKLVQALEKAKRKDIAEKVEALVLTT